MKKSDIFLWITINVIFGIVFFALYHDKAPKWQFVIMLLFIVGINIFIILDRLVIKKEVKQNG